MKILIGADLVPTESNFNLFEEGNTDALVGQELLMLLQSADYRVFNLEVPLTDHETPVDKCGPALIAPTATVEGYKALGVNLLTLSNNHILDQGVNGLESTVSSLKSAGISYVGAGENLQEAEKPFLLEIDGKKIGVYACAEHEFSIAEENTPGANPFEPLESPDHVAQLKAQCDYVIVLYHGGKEHYRYPSPNLQKLCRKLVEKGADLVICQHSHCIGCEEKYLHGTIVYGQGNFLFDYSTSEYWQTSLLVQIGEDYRISYIPLAKNGNGVRLAQLDKAKKIIEDFNQRSCEIQRKGFIQEQYTQFAKEMREHYLLSMSSIKNTSFGFRLLNKLTGRRWCKWYIKRIYNKKKLIAIRNFVECEAHNELLIQGLKQQ